MKFIVLVVIILCYFLANIFQNRLSGSLENRIYPANLFQVVWMLLAIIVFAVIGTSTDGLHFSKYTVTMGALAGVCTIAGGMCLLGAMATGPLSLTILIFSMYVIVPPALAVPFLGEEITVCQLIGMIIILAVLIFSNYSGTEEKQSKSHKWWLLCLGSVLGMGLANYIMKVHQYHLPDQDIWEYSIASYMAGVVMAGIVGTIFFSREKKKTEFQPYNFSWKSFWAPAVGMAVTEGMANLGNLYNASRLPAIVIYPVSQLGTLMLTVLFGLIVLKEKLTKVSAVCLVLGMAAIVLMNF